MKRPKSQLRRVVLSQLAVHAHFNAHGYGSLDPHLATEFRLMALRLETIAKRGSRKNLEDLFGSV